MFDDILNLNEWEIMQQLERDEPELYGKVQDGLRDGTVDWSDALTTAYLVGLRRKVRESDVA